MRIRSQASAIHMALALSFALLLAGCTSGRSEIQFTKGNMLHAQQVLERYDANGNPLPQYLELWLTKEAGRCTEINEDGLEIAVALDTAKEHLYWDAITMDGEKSGESRMFLVSFDAMKKLYPKIRTQNDGVYAGRDCRLYRMDTGNEQEWVKLYVDKATGFVLLCDSETFRLRTRLLEDIPLDEGLFDAPAGLKLKGGDGK